jgi:hypothetical protein
VLERLQRANRALRQGQAPLALIQLSELDRQADEALHEERETTRGGARYGGLWAARCLAVPAFPRSDARCLAGRMICRNRALSRVIQWTLRQDTQPVTRKDGCR